MAQFTPFVRLQPTISVAKKNIKRYTPSYVVKKNQQNYTFHKDHGCDEQKIKFLHDVMNNLSVLIFYLFTVMAHNNI